MKRNYLLVAIAGGLILAIVLGLRQTFGLFLEPVTGDLDIGRAPYAFALALMNLLWGLGSPFAGAIADRFGPAKVAIVGGLTYAAGLVLMSQSHDSGMLILSGVLLGFGLSGAGFTVILGAVGRAAPAEKRSQALGLASMGGSLGQFIAIPYVTGLFTATSTATGLDWVLVMLILAATSLFVIPLSKGIAGLTAKDSGGGTKQSVAEAMREASGTTSFWLLTAGFFVCGFHLAFIGVHLPSFVQDKGLSVETAAVALMLIGIFNIAGTYVAGLLGARFIKKHVLSLIYLARAVLFLFILISPVTEFSVYIFASLMGFLWLGTVPLTSGLVATMFGPAYMSMLYGVVFFSHQVGSFAGVWLAGYLYDSVQSYDVMWILSAGLAILSAVLHMPIVERPVPRLEAEIEAASA